MNGFMGFLKANKKAIITRTLIIGGAIAGLVIVVLGAKKKKDAEDEDFNDVEENEDCSE